MLFELSSVVRFQGRVVRNYYFDPSCPTRRLRFGATAEEVKNELGVTQVRGINFSLFEFNVFEVRNSLPQGYPLPIRHGEMMGTSPFLGRISQEGGVGVSLMIRHALLEEGITLLEGARLGKVEDFNGFQEKHHLKFDFSGLQFLGMQSPGLNLSRINLRYARMEGDLKQIRLEGSRAPYLYVKNADLTGGQLSGEKTWLNDALFEEVDLTNVNFQKARLKGARFNGVGLNGADFRGATFTGARLDDVIITPELLRKKGALV